MFQVPAQEYNPVVTWWVSPLGMLLGLLLFAAVLYIRIASRQKVKAPVAIHHIVKPPSGQLKTRENPFKIGDRVVFDPDGRTIGWTWSSFDRLRIQPGDKGVVTKITDDLVFIEDGRGGFHWESFKLLNDLVNKSRS